MSQPAQAESSRRFPRAGPLVLTVEESGSTRLVRVAGDLDLATVGQLTAALDRPQLNGATLLVLDLQELDFLDLAGLRTILRADDYCNNHQIPLTVIKPRGFAGRVFTLTGAHRELDLVDAPAAGRLVTTK